MAVINAKLLCLCLVAVAATVAAHEAQTLPGKGGKGQHGVQTLPAYIGGGGVPPRNPQVQPRPDSFDGRPGNNLKPIVRPGRPSNRPGKPSNPPISIPPYSGPLTKPRPRPSKGGDRDRRFIDYYSDESDERRYRRQVDDEEPEDDGDEEYYDEE